jgi:amidase
VERVAAEIEGLGVSVDQVTLPLEGFREPLVTVWSVGMAAVPLPDLERVHPVVRMQVEAGRSTTAVRYERARIRLHRLGRTLRLAMSSYDAVLLPVLTTPPKPIGFLEEVEGPEEIFDLLPYTYPFNATGQPAVAIPAGHSGVGLPIGAQLVGRLGEDERVAALAARWEAARGLPHPTPPV